MALVLALRTACRSKATLSPICQQISKLSSSSILPRINSTLITKSNLLQKQNVISSKLPSSMLLGSRQISLSNVVKSAENVNVGHHAKLWTIERGISAGLLFVLPAAIAFPCQPLDAILAVSMVMHAHWGLEAVVVDYVRPVLVGNVVPKLAHGLLILFSAATLAGLLYFIHNDVGIGNGVRKLWSVKSQ